MAQRFGVNAIEFAGFDERRQDYKDPFERELRGLDAKVQSRALDKDLNSPPATPYPGAVYIVGGSPTGEWSGRQNQIARWNEYALGWEFWVPKSGWSFYLIDESRYYRFSGTDWLLRDIEDRESPEARIYGAVGDGASDDTTPVASAIAACDLVQEFKVTTFDNLIGADVTPSGVAHNRTLGVGRVYNPRKHRFMPFFGQETLHHWFGLFPSDSNANWDVPITAKKAVFSGDSVTYGVGSESGAGIVGFFGLYAKQRGYVGIESVNRGQSGKNSGQWLSDYLAGDLALNPNLYLIGWGANDAGFWGPEQTLANVRTALTTIRAAKTPAQMSIILRTPTTMNDMVNGRTQAWAEKVNDGFRQLARDFDCAFLDTYSLFQNSHSAANVWMDGDIYGGLPAAIHPHDTMYESITNAHADLALPVSRGGRVNGMINRSVVSDADSIVDSADALESYAFAGIDIRRINGDANGGPHNGVAFAVRQVDGASVQFSFPVWGKTPGIGISCRLNCDGVWSPWLGASGDAAPWLDNSWTTVVGAYATYGTTLEGYLRLDGLIAPGTIADGARIASVPDEYRPGALPGDRRFLIATSHGAATAKISSNGDLLIYSVNAAATWVSLSGISWKIGG